MLVPLPAWLFGSGHLASKMLISFIKIGPKVFGYRRSGCKSVSKFGKNGCSRVVFLLRCTLNRSGLGTEVEGKPHIVFLVGTHTAW